MKECSFSLWEGVGARAVFGILLSLALAACGESRSVTERATEPDSSFDPNSLSYKAIPPTDLPPEGTRSLFDHIIAENGSLPYPFEELVRLIASYDAEGRAPVTVLIPDGRSLLKGQADFRRPRIILAADPRPAPSEAELGPLLRGRLFLGFVEGAAEIEIISYNEAAGRFEFQLVKDYREGGSPRLVYAKRAICTTCHAGATPIFPVRPWEETSGQPAISQAILEARGARAGNAYHGVPIVNPLSAPETIDELTEVGNVIPTVQRVWIDGCGGDPAQGPACRRQMLKLALRYLVQPAEFNTADPDYRRLVELQTPHWPAGGIALPNGDLLNRNPFVDKPRRTPWQWLAGLLPAGSEDEVADAKLSDFDKLPPLRRELDPLTPRAPKEILQPGAPTAIAGLARMFSDNDKRLLERHSGYDLARLQAAVDKPALDAVLGPAPFQRQATMQALLAALGARPPQASFLDTAEMSAPMVEGMKPIAIREGSVLKLYEHYCFGCHRGNPSAKLDFMNGATEEEVLARIRETTSIREALDYERYLGTDKANKLMPPVNSWQRRELDQARAEGRDDIARMLEAVPGLFDF
ncbi:MAG TPA: hypothetical protein VNJ47_12000 [Nevskiales bacterium]|nr:hypothetical protein [Nevskiales bacterium]